MSQSRRLQCVAREVRHSVLPRAIPRTASGRMMTVPGRETHRGPSTWAPKASPHTAAARRAAAHRKRHRPAAMPSPCRQALPSPQVPPTLRCMNTAAHVCVRLTRPAARPALCQLYPRTIMRATNTVTRSLRVPSSMMSACMLTTGHVFTLHPRGTQTRLSFQTCSMPHHMRCIRVEAETTRGLCRGVWPHRCAAIFGTAGLPHCAGSPGVMGVRRTLLWSPRTDAQTLTESCLMQRRMLRLVISSGRLHVHSHTRAQCSPAARRQAIGAVARAAAEGGCRDRGAAHC